MTFEKSDVATIISYQRDGQVLVSNEMIEGSHMLSAIAKFLLLVIGFPYCSSL